MSDTFSLFFNPTGKKVFEYVCSNPGSYLMSIGESMNLDRMSVSRHLERLHDAGMVKRLEYKGRTIYYPRGLRAVDIEAAFSQLKNPCRKDMFLHVLNFPGINQSAIVNRFPGMSERQVRRHLASLVDSGLIEISHRGRSVTYTTGPVGKKIIIGSFETIDPLVNMIRDVLGSEVLVSIENNIVKIDMMNGETISFQLGKWEMMELDDKTIYENKYMLLGEGGEQVLVSIYSKCRDIASIQKMTTLPEKVVKAKIETLRRMQLVADFQKERDDLTITERGKSVVEMIMGVKNKVDHSQRSVS